MCNNSWYVQFHSDTQYISFTFRKRTKVPRWLKKICVAADALNMAIGRSSSSTTTACHWERKETSKLYYIIWMWMRMHANRSGNEMLARRTSEAVVVALVDIDSFCLFSFRFCGSCEIHWQKESTSRRSRKLKWTGKLVQTHTHTKRKKWNERKWTKFQPQPS